MQDLNEDILKRTYRMRSLCNNAEMSGIKANVVLAEQGEQIKNIHSSLITIDTTLIDTKQNINRLKGRTQRVMNTVRTKFHPKFFSKLIPHSPSKDSSLSLLQTPPLLPDRRHSSPKLIQTPPTPIKKSFLDEQIDETLYDIGHTVQRLKYIAQDMNDKLVGQVNTFNQIHEHMMQSTNSIEQQNTEIAKIFT
ncbi:unnamed protein product [Adineta steineri]|uniref:t-SNARE coiled-coil homology domain-containing protein n=1 Tax=Adineta steineri TaxID=433720 RepID=A0A819ILP7_9BILA|nr:unnamed protein product [Adineta steineri]CAF1069923.1 unnamed protein product [Adineta steineri]CAF1150921.1 unnamed protein product [Adineta steineri]CAF1187214.1 unnamed protein product [Adineta steineri]CAF1238803.1 unnamed protein product [Adineta steineri]